MSFVLYRDVGCPFAHRVAALFAHLGVTYEERSALVGDKPAGLEAVSPAGRIPALSHGELALYDSLVMGEYVAALHGFALWADDPGERAVEQLLSRRYDESLVGGTMAAFCGQAPDSSVSDMLDELEWLAVKTTRHMGWLAIQLGSFQMLLREHRPEVAEALLARPALAAWAAFGESQDCVREAWQEVAFAPKFGVIG
ncbi:MAG: hypothetical protein EP330_08190 [Deltaproteobacteria bacterium]|nr:MAG: hypothetical protein EP330_08190 [Deltaproteobacteria bacterium]